MAQTLRDPDRAVLRTARKTHLCVACEHEAIHTGDQYVEWTVMAKPYGSGWRYCLPCAERESFFEKPS